MKRDDTMTNPQEILQRRSDEIREIVNDLKVGESGEIEYICNNIAAYRTSFKRYLDKYNETQVVGKSFSITKDATSSTGYRVWRNL